MKNIQLLSILGLVIMSVFANCTTVDENIWFTKDATACAEAWYDEPWINPQPAVNAQTWLEMQGVTVLESEYDPAGTAPEACNACTCLSGGVHHVQVDAEFTDIMVSEGFTME